MALLRESIGSVSLVRQGEHKFYSLTMPTDILTKCCFVISRDEDPIVGFQRELDEKRAKEIAAYIDSGFTIPSSIVLSAQDGAELLYDSKKKSISFNIIPKAFLIIDGQHRVYGFMFAKTAFRIPVVIYDGLSKRDETRLFIDINSKQKGVPPELLLDIKKLAEYETSEEERLRQVYDSFINESDSCFSNRLSPAKKVKGKISRSVFNTAVKPLIKIFGSKTESEIYEILNVYFTAFDEAILRKHNLHEQLYNTTIFKSICGFLPIAASKVKDKSGAIYTIDNFYSVLEVIGDRIKKSRIESPGGSYKPLIDYYESLLKSDFTL
ncbi:MAG: DGQHR domain-containing protein [Deltaproteobacteria bacterium]|nr:MAG: DGQHR domain-containing protein [Deltaproteobacteria bacterium]